MPSQKEDAAGAPQRTIIWVRKRDGTVASFDPAKLSSSIFAARSQVDPQDAAFHAQELSQAVVHFLEQEFEGQSPTTSAIGECIVKVLREIGQGPTAAAYADFRTRRAEMRRRILVVESGREPAASPPLARSLGDGATGQSWDKSHVVALLAAESNLDAATAREIAAAVERKLLLCEWVRLPATMIQSFIDLELAHRGLRRPWRLRRELSIPLSLIEATLSDVATADDTQRLIGRELVRQFTLAEVYSPDISALHEDGLLQLFDSSSPSHWSAMAAQRCTDEELAGDTASVCSQWEARLNWSLRNVSGTLALDVYDLCIRLACAAPDCIAEAAAGIGLALRRALRDRSTFVVMNLGASAGGPTEDLFGSWLETDTAARLRELQLAVAEACLADPDLSRKCRIDYHMVPAAAAWQPSELKPWLRWVQKAAPLCICFDRPHHCLAEGVTRRSGRTAVVVQFAGIHLPRLHARMGRATDEESVMQRLGLLCDSAVRAGVQRREFLRRQMGGSGFPDQPVLVVVPIGLDALVADLVGKPIAVDDAALAMAEQILKQMQLRLRREGRHYGLQTKLDGIAHALWAGDAPDGGSPRDALGITAAMAGPGPKQQVRAAGLLHGVVEGGTAMCRLADPGGDIDRLLEIVQFAATQTPCNRLAFQAASRPRQDSLSPDWLS